MLVSVLIPTRKRSKLAIDAIESLIEKSSDFSNFEIVIRCDDDDNQSPDLFEYFYSKYAGKDLKITTLIGPRYGYRRMHEYFNEMITRSCGDWIFPFCDDSIMMTNNWDKALERHCKHFAVLNPQTNHHRDLGYILPLYPIVPRKMIEIIGTWPEYHADTIFGFIAAKLHFFINIPIFIQHNRFDIVNSEPDETTRDANLSKADEFDFVKGSEIVNRYSRMIASHFSAFKEKSLSEQDFVENINRTIEIEKINKE